MDPIDRHEGPKTWLQASMDGQQVTQLQVKEIIEAALKPVRESLCQLADYMFIDEAIDKVKEIIDEKLQERDERIKSKKSLMKNYKNEMKRHEGPKTRLQAGMDGQQVTQLQVKEIIEAALKPVRESLCQLANKSFIDEAIDKVKEIIDAKLQERDEKIKSLEDCVEILKSKMVVLDSLERMRANEKHDLPINICEPMSAFCCWILKMRSDHEEADVKLAALLKARQTCLTTNQSFFILHLVMLISLCFSLPINMMVSQC